MSWEDRHPATQEKMRWLEPNPNLPPGLPAQVSGEIWNTSCSMVSQLSDGPQLSLGLQHLIDAKDCLVRQAIADSTS